MTNIEILRLYFGFDSFKDIQEQVINNLLAGKNSLCLMPTGGGKSLIYQVAGLQTGKATIVISPLLALMKQQNKRLLDQGINTLAYNSSLGDVKTQFTKLRKSFEGTEIPKFIFVSPEKILSDGYLEFILKKYRAKIGLIVIDEAHCISQWGHTFRPAYKAIPLFIQNIYGESDCPPLLALTATLNPKDKMEICSDLKILESNIFKSKLLIRSNLKLEIAEQVGKNEEKKDQLLQILNQHKDQKIIVYTHIKAREYGTREMTKAFQDLGFNCHYFDADMQDNEKLLILEKFETGEIKIVFATSAFGMGIDIPDIRVVVHYLVPESIEQYYQEVGRAGRDGKPAFGYLLFSETNFKVRRDLIKKSLPSPERIREIFDTSIQSSNQNNANLKRRKPIEKTLDTEKIYSLARTDVREDNSEMVIFLFLLSRGIIKLRGKGVQFLDCFEANSKSQIFASMQEASAASIVTQISKKLNKSIELLNHELFMMYTQGEIKLSKVPVNVMNYSVVGALSDELVQDIHSTLEARNQNRLTNFERLVSFISSSNDPVKVISEYLGI
jgi:ATP-dependent DNA helicase RecQ